MWEGGEWRGGLQPPPPILISPSRPLNVPLRVGLMGFSRCTPTLFKGFARRRFTAVTLWWRPLKTEASFLVCWRRRRQRLAQNISAFSSLYRKQMEYSGGKHPLVGQR